jgi:hypothetical protein
MSVCVMAGVPPMTNIRSAMGRPATSGRWSQPLASSWSVGCPRSPTASRPYAIPCRHQHAGGRGRAAGFGRVGGLVVAHRALTAECRGRRRPPPTSANRARRGAGTTLLAAVGPHDQQVVDQVEVVLEAHLALVKPAGGQAAHVQVQGDVSPVVAGRGGGQLDLADDLGPQVQGGLGRLPGLQRKLGQVGPRGGGLLDLVMARRSP